MSQIHRDRASADLSRRRLLQLALATGAAAGVASRAQAQTPRQGGTLKMAWASSPRTLDPALTIQGDEYMITQAAYDNLTRVDEKLQPQPMLATRWAGDAQARTWTFTLRQGVKFHHGRELKASDVVFTFERILDPKTASPGRTALGPIEKVEAVDDYTVRFRMSAPYADLPVNLGRRSAGSCPPIGPTRSSASRRAPGPSASRSSSPASARAWCGSPTTGTSPVRTSTSCGR